MKEIAEKTGVSISTVSRILNQDPKRKVRGETAERVIEAANELGFFDQKLFSVQHRKMRTYNLGCVFTSGFESFVSPFFSSLLDGIQKEVSYFGTVCKINFYTFNISEFDFRQALVSSSLDGAVVLGRTNLDTINFLKKSVPILVYAGLNRMGGMDEVVCDAYEGEKTVVRHLLSDGHREIAFVGPTGKKDAVFNEYRYQGYVDALALAGIALNPEWVHDCVLTSQGGYAAAMELLRLSTLPTAIVCGNDTTALGVFRALTEKGVKVPEEISLVGFDDIESAAYMSPSLTTVHVPKSELGRFAVKLLVDRLEHPRSYHVQMAIPFEFIERESSGKVRKE